RDGVDMTSDEFFTRLAASTSLPTTSAPSPGEFAEVYRRLAKDHDGCISIHIGAKLSATVEAARVGAESVAGFKVNVIDSQTVSMPMAFLCSVAAECASLEEAMAKTLRPEFAGLEVPVGQSGCGLGTHTGPKALGLGYIKK